MDAATLTEAQRDGLACVTCGRDYLAEAVPTPHVPVGSPGGQLSWQTKTTRPGRSAAGREGAPRARGDDPDQVPHLRHPVQCSPRTRG